VKKTLFDFIIEPLEYIKGVLYGLRRRRRRRQRQQRRLKEDWR